MADPFLGEIRLMSFSFPPRDWALCNGQLLPINQNQALFSLLGTMYGGNGQTTFALPNLQGRVPMGVGNNHTQGETGGVPWVSLSLPELPAHTHTLHAEPGRGTVHAPAGNRLAGTSNGWTDQAAATTLSPSSLSEVGGSQAHENRQPFLTVSYCISLVGIFPSRN